MIDRQIAASPVLLLGMPRSGTTWLSQIFESSPQFLVRLSPNFSHRLKNQIDATSTREAWIDQLVEAANCDDAFMTQNWRRDTGELARFDSATAGSETHLAIKDTRFHELYQRALSLLPGARCIYVVRHPAGAINSWWRSKEFPPDAILDREWRGGACRKDGPGEHWGFDDWRLLTDRYLDLEELHPQRYCTFRYEDLVADPIGEASGCSPSLDARSPTRPSRSSSSPRAATTTAPTPSTKTRR